MTSFSRNKLDKDLRYGSARVIGNCCWKTYAKAHFRGRGKLYRQGDSATLRRIKSIEKVPCDPADTKLPNAILPVPADPWPNQPKAMWPNNPRPSYPNYQPYDAFNQANYQG